MSWNCFKLHMKTKIQLHSQSFKLVNWKKHNIEEKKEFLADIMNLKMTY